MISQPIKDQQRNPLKMQKWPSMKKKYLRWQSFDLMIYLLCSQKPDFSSVTENFLPVLQKKALAYWSTYDKISHFLFKIEIWVKIPSSSTFLGVDFFFIVIVFQSQLGVKFPSESSSITAVKPAITVELKWYDRWQEGCPYALRIIPKAGKTWDSLAT